MELSQFVSESLRQIVQGVIDANTQILSQGAEVNPHLELGQNLRNYVSGPCGNRMVKEIEFDVAVTTSEDTNKKGCVGVFSGWVGIGGQASSSETASGISRLRFSVPLLLPSHTGPPMFQTVTKQ